MRQDIEDAAAKVEETIRGIIGSMDDDISISVERDEEGG